MKVSLFGRHSGIFYVLCVMSMYEYRRNVINIQEKNGKFLLVHFFSLSSKLIGARDVTAGQIIWPVDTIPPFCLVLCCLFFSDSSRTRVHQLKATWGLCPPLFSLFKQGV